MPIVASVAATAIYAGAQNCEPIAIQHFQYQAKAEPVFVPTAAPETVTSDKWAVRISEPRQDVKRQQFTYPSFFAQRLFVAPPTITPLYVSAQACEPISITHFQYPSLTRPTFVPAAAPETITLDKWLSYWPQPTFKPKRLIQYGVNIAVAEQADDGLPPVHWQQPTNVPLRRIKPNVATGTFQLRQTTFTETTTVDKWFRRTQEPTRDVPRRQYAYQVVASDYLSQVPGAEVIRLDKWNKNYPDQIFRLRRLVEYGSFTIDPTLRAERASLEKWVQPLSEPRRDVRRQQHLFAVSVSDYLSQVPGAEVIRLDKWFVRPYERFESKRPPLSDRGVRPIFTSTGLYDLGWYQPQEVPVRTLTGLQNLYPHLAIDAAFFLVPGIDYLSPSKDIDSVILLTADSKVLTLTISDVDSLSAITTDTDSMVIIYQDVDSL